MAGEVRNKMIVGATQLLARRGLPFETVAKPLIEQGRALRA